MLKNAPPLFELARRFEEHAKGMVVPGTIFEEFGFNYVGPIDGHDLDALIPTLENLRDKKGPQFLHVVTKKGYGYKLAEADPVLYHGPGKFDPAVGLRKPATPPKPTFTQVFGQWLCDMAAADDAGRHHAGDARGLGHGRVPASASRSATTTSASPSSTPSRFAAGLACEGLKPVVAIYSTFLQRGYDQLIHDVAIQNLPVVFALDRAGIVGDDGATHAGAFDIAYLRCIPNMGVLTPADEDECRQALSTAYRRGPAGGGALSARRRRRAPSSSAARRAALGARRVSVAVGERIAILAFGTLLYPALAAADGSTPRWPTCASSSRSTPRWWPSWRGHDALVTVEEGSVMGGAGWAVMEALHAAGLATPVLALGLPDQFIEHGEPAKLLALVGLDAAGIERSIVARFGPGRHPAAANG